MKTSNDFYHLSCLASMRAHAMEYRRTLTWSLWDGDWNGRIKQAMTFLDLAKTYRSMAREN